MDQLLALIRDPAWQFVGAVLGLIAIGVTVWLPWLLRTKRALVYQILSSTPLIKVAQVADDIRSRIAITLDGKTVENVDLVLVKIRNAGTKAIRRDEYERSISLFFGPQAQILSADVTEVADPNLQVTALIQKDKQGVKVVVPPVGISKGEWFTIKTLVTGATLPVKVDWRIPDVPVKSQKERETEAIPPSAFLFFARGYMAGIALGMITAFIIIFVLLQILTVQP
jgi:hypothetical protein